MDRWVITTDSYFDGDRRHERGPYHLLVEKGRIARIGRGVEAGRSEVFAAPPREHVPFLMPGLAEAHCHLFLDGGELDFAARSAHLKGPVEAMRAVAGFNVGVSLASGITLIRDAGDKFGVNHAVRDEVNGRGDGPLIRSAGVALHRAKNYGAFMARPVDSEEDIRAAIAEVAETADDLKIILTGIIDFQAGAVTAPVQFSLKELELIVGVARDHGLNTFAHCSGLDGVHLATAAGVGSIEHGFFLDERALDAMAKKEIAWVPTFSPVHFQWARPDIAGWDGDTVDKLRRILDDHLGHARTAGEFGVSLVAGSDAGSHGVRHGAALVDELFFFMQAGVAMDEVLRSATRRPRRLWGADPADIVEGGRAEFIALPASPFTDAAALRAPLLAVREGRILHRSGGADTPARQRSAG